MAKTKPITTARASITAPVPATGAVSMDDAAKLHIEFDIDLSHVIARGVLTKTVPDMAAVLRANPDRPRRRSDPTVPRRAGSRAVRGGSEGGGTRERGER